MILPAKPSENADNNFVVCDIENWPDGSVLHVGTSWRSENDLGSISHRVDNDWKSWWDFVRIEARKHKRFRRIYAHNGGGWDWVSFAEFLINNKQVEIEDISIARAMSKMIVMTIKVSDRFSIQFCDSLYLLRSSLKELSKVFLNDDGKRDLDGKLPHEIFVTDPDRYFAYLSADCSSLLRVLEMALSAIRKIAPINMLGSTIGSTAMKVFRTGFLKTPISVPENEKHKDFLREGYRGGRVEVFQYGYHKDIRIYDINSLYPHAMVTCEMPISGRMQECNVYREKCVGVYRITFNQTRRDIPPIFLVDGNGSYSGSGVFFSPEIQLFREQNAGEFRVLEGYIFPDVGFPFKSFVESLYNWRLSDKKGAVGLLCKYLLNSLYGKFGQKATREHIECYQDAEQRVKAMMKHRPYPEDALDKRNKNVVSITEDGLISGVEEKTDVTFEHVGIAGMITSQARVLLYQMILEAGVKNVVYSDTDSIHCFGRKLDRYIGSGLGMLKLEAEGEGVYCGKKLYGIRENSSDSGSKNPVGISGEICREMPHRIEKIRAKGVSIGGRNGCQLSFDDMVAISRGTEIVCNFSQPASILDVLKGKDSSCRIGSKNGGHNRHRKLRRT